MSFKVEADNGNSRTVESRAEAEDVKEDMEGLGMDVEIKQAESDGGSTKAKVVETPSEDPRMEAEPEPAAKETDLQERQVSEDPFEWMPGHYVDHIDGSPAINRQGYAVLAEFYEINVVSDVMVGPEETDFEYCRCEATAYDSEGNEYRAHGSAHVDRGDDKSLLLEMADTRATKRVLAIATGVGAVAVEELKNEL